MGKNKLRHFAEMKTFSCVFEPSNEVLQNDEFPSKGKWHEHFQNTNPITVELGCGKGEYTLALAERYPQRNHIGIDVKGARIWRGAKTAEENQSANVAFVRSKIEFINSIFAPNEIDEIWLTFSDPQPKDKKGTKRLSGDAFLKRYGRVLKKGGVIKIKSDSLFFFDATMETIQKGGHKLLRDQKDIYGAGREFLTEEERDILSVKTFYELKWLAEERTINYMSFQLNDEYYQDI